MSLVDDIVQAVGASTKLDATMKSVLTEFVQTAGPAIAALTPSVVQELIGNFAAGDSAAAIGPLSSALTPEQVVNFLGATQQEMSAELDTRTQQVAAAHAAVSSIEQAAVSVLAKLLISAI
jgi:ABC-type Fe2+-enterobactin transport system substrate-binding protein